MLAAEEQYSWLDLFLDFEPKIGAKIVNDE